MSALDLVFQYRTLLGKCELGAGLEWDDIETLTGLEAHFKPGADDLHAREGRKFRRESVALTALVRSASINDRVAVTELGPGGLVLDGAPYAEESSIVEIVIDDADRSLSYRFKAQVRWLRDDGDDYRIGVAFIGLPVLVHYGPASEVTDTNVVHKIAA
jgi:hypothetical protein